VRAGSTKKKTSKFDKLALKFSNEMKKIMKGQNKKKINKLKKDLMILKKNDRKKSGASTKSTATEVIDGIKEGMKELNNAYDEMGISVGYSAGPSFGPVVRKLIHGGLWVGTGILAVNGVEGAWNAIVN
jgi:hypothetical protein